MCPCHMRDHIGFRCGAAGATQAGASLDEVRVSESDCSDLREAMCEDFSVLEPWMGVCGCKQAEQGEVREGEDSLHSVVRLSTASKMTLTVPQGLTGQKLNSALGVKQAIKSRLKRCFCAVSSP